MTDTEESLPADDTPGANPFADDATPSGDATAARLPTQASDNPYLTPGLRDGNNRGVQAASAGNDNAADADAQKPPAPHPHIGWGILWTIAMMAAQIGVSAVAVVLLVIVAIASGSSPSDLQAQAEQWTPILLPVGTFTTLLTAVVIAVIVFRRDTFRLLGLRRCTPLQMLVAVLFVFPHAVVAGELGNWALEFLPAAGLETFEVFSQQNLILVLIAAAVFPGVGEEIFFRGFLSRGLIGSHGLVAGAVVSSLFFALIHIIPVQVCVTFLAGLTLQYVFLTTRSLWTSIVFHVINNSLAFVLMRYGGLLPIPGVTVTSDVVVSHTPVLLLLVSVVTCGLLAAVLYYGRTIWVAADGQPWEPGYFATAQPPASTGAKPFSYMPSPLLLAGAGLMYAAFVAVVIMSAG